MTLVTVVTVGPPPARAQTLAPEPQITTRFLNGAPLERAARRQLARIWRDEVLQLRDALPPLTLAETAEVDRDYDQELARSGGAATKLSRAARASPAFRKREALRVVGENLTILTILSTPDLTPAREMLAWAQVAANWMDRSFNATLVDMASADEAARKALFTNPMQSGEGVIQARQRRGRLIIVTMVVPHLAQGAGR